MRLSRFAATLIAFSTALCAWGGETPRRPTPEIRFIAAGIRAKRATRGPLQAVLTLEQTISREEMALTQAEPVRVSAGDERWGYDARWYLDGDNMALVVTDRADPAGKAAQYWRRFVVSEDVVRRLDVHVLVRGDPASTVYRGVVASAGGIKNGVPQGWERYDLRSYAYFEDTTPLDEVLLDPRYHVTLEGEERCLGSSCYKVNVQWQDRRLATTYWIDQEHGLLIRRARLYAQMAGKRVLVRQVDVPDLIGGSGIWFPKVYDVKTQFVIRETSLSSRRLSAIPRDRITVRDGVAYMPPGSMQMRVSSLVSSAPVPPEAFTLEWPVGTEVSDSITQSAFVVRAVPLEEDAAKPGHGSSQEAGPQGALGQETEPQKKGNQ